MNEMAGCTTHTHFDEADLVTIGGFHASDSEEATLHHGANPEAADEEPLTNDNRRSKIVEKVPIELLQSVFRCCDPQVPLVTHLHGAADHPIFTLMKVCSVWRRVVLGTPELWTNVCAEDDSRGHALATRWLSRAKMIPRKLEISCIREFPSHPLERLISQFPFRSLAINFCYARIFYFSKVPIASFLPLRELYLSFDGATNVSELSFSPHTFSNLQSLTFHGYLPFRHPTILPKLSDLGLDRMPPSECLNFIRLAPGLETCHMYAYSSQSLTSSVEHVVAPYIKHLTMTCRDGNDIRENHFQR